MFLDLRMKPPKQLRSSESRLKSLYNLEKWNTSDFPHSITSPNWLSKERNNIVTTKNICVFFSKFFLKK